jgi:hypothetical protein
MSERRISGYQTALRGSLEVFNLAHPAGQWVPSGENQGHHPSLMNAGEGCRAEALAKAVRKCHSLDSNRLRKLPTV